MIDIKEIGGACKVAKTVGRRPPTVSKWKRIPEKHCPTIEMFFDGKFTCEQLRPDVVWIRVVDPQWPHPDGRPLLDFFATSLSSPA